MKNKTLIGRLTVSWATVALLFWRPLAYRHQLGGSVSATFCLALHNHSVVCIRGRGGSGPLCRAPCCRLERLSSRTLDGDHRGCVDWHSGAWRQVLSDTWPRYDVRGPNDRLERRRRALPTVRWELVVSCFATNPTRPLLRVGGQTTSVTIEA